MSNWAKKAIFYHIYPLGFCGAPFENVQQEQEENRIQKVIEWIPHFKALGINAIYLGPVFESRTHGYDTTDYRQIDKRLGSNKDFKVVCRKLHEADIKVVLDGVFNHVGRDFFAFKDLQKNGMASRYKDWFQNVNFGGSSPMGDSFYYEAWEGHYELVKLNLQSEEVRQYLLQAIGEWIDEFEIDGLRLDVAYCLDENFLRALRQFVDGKKEDFWLMGEIIHGDYSRLIKPDLLESTTNYECYKGIYSSHNERNYFEINYSLNRLFGQGGLYQGFDLYNFVDNHDVERLASILKEKKHIENVYTLLFTIPGIPSIYYGSEWGLEGKKDKGSDKGLRPELDLLEMLKLDQKLVMHIYELSTIKKKYKALTEGMYEQIIVKNEQLLFARTCGTSKVYVALNLADSEAVLKLKGNSNVPLINILGKKEEIPLEGNDYVVQVPPFSARILVAKIEVREEIDTDIKSRIEKIEEKEIKREIE